MNVQKISQMARLMIRAHGERALVEVARRQAQEERRGNRAEAENWQKVRSSINNRRGAKQT